MGRMPYATDLSDDQWALIEPMVTEWKQERVARSATGDPGSCDLREVVNAMFYQNRTGCQWRLLPHDLPAWSAVFYYFTLWREDGLDQRIQELLRCQVRERARRLEDPSLVIIDTQSVRVAAGVPKETTGLDANKKTPGRKRGLAVDVLGLIIGVVILAASAHDNDAGIALLDQAAERCGMRLEKALVDQGFKDAVIIHGAVKDITVEVVRRNPDDQGKGFLPQPKRWVVEQVNGTLMLHRRLARDYDHRPDNAASRVYWASTAGMLRRLTTPTPTWRDDVDWPRERLRTPAAAADRTRRDRSTSRHPARADRAAHHRPRRDRRPPGRAHHHPQGHRRPHLTRPGNGPSADHHRHRLPAIVATFNEHPGKVFRVHDLHEHLGLPTDEPSINVTRSRLGRLARQGFLEQPGRGRYQKRT